MSSYARVLVLLLLVTFTTALGAGCTLGPNGDYQVAVSWLINGTTPNADLCAEQRIARFRFEVRTGGGRVLKTVEADCASTRKLEDGNTYGGFLSTASFDWETDYFYALTPVDAQGTALSPPAERSFVVRYNEADIWELGYLDYLQPIGTAAGLSVDWVLDNSTTPLVDQCRTRKIKTVRILASSALDEKLENAVQIAEAPCSDGKYASASKVLARGFYSIFLVAITENDTVAAESKPESVLVDDSQSVMPMNRAVFF
jgi:hypothetical protein